MQKVGEFEKVSFREFQSAWEECFADTLEEVEELYQHIKLPVRATSGSAGYDFFSPIPLTLSPRESILIPTGIKVKIEDGWFLAIVPKSGLGFKYRLQVDNTIGVIDSDYYHSDNEGHIFIKMTNDTNEDKVLEIKRGQSVCQGIFMPFGVTFNDNVHNVRNGGLGSTSK